MLTAKADDLSKVRLLQDKVQDYVTKPFSDQELLARIGSLVKERRRVSDSLHKLEERVRATFEQAAVGIAHLSLDGQWLNVNQRLCDILGYSREELLAPQFRERHHPEDLNADLAALNLLLSDDLQTHVAEKRYVRKDGQTVWINQTLSLVIDSQGQPDYFIGVVEDICRRKEAEQNLMRAKEAAEAATLAKNAFLANMSHEMRTPLHQIQGFGHLMQYSPLTPKQATWMAQLESAARRLTGIIDAILKLSDLEAGTLPVQQVHVDVSKLMAHAMASVQERATQKHLQMTLQIDSLPKDLVGDPSHLETAVRCYLDNALTFTQAGSVSIHVNLEAEDPSSALLRFEVQDTGTGIPPEARSRLFTAFEQADNSHTRAHGGTGIGLVMAQKLAQLMGGKAGCSSELGVGSSFWFSARLQKAGEPSTP